MNEELGKHLNLGEYEVVDIMPIPMQGDRMVRLRTIEEALEELASASEESGAQGYFIQVKPRKALMQNPAPLMEEPAFEPSLEPEIDHEPQVNLHTQVEAADPIYLNDGKLNLAYLAKNAELLFTSGDYTLARNIYKAILQSGERTAAAYMGLARCFEAEGRIEEARINFEESIAYHPSPEAYRSLSSILIRQGKDQQAAECLERAASLKEITPEVRFDFHKACGNCWLRARNFAEADRHFRLALGINASASEIHSNLGALNLEAGKLVDARRHFQDALAASPSNDKALAGLASCFLAEGDKRMAHDHFAKALDVNLNNPQALLQLVKCAYEIKSYATAARILEEYTQSAPVSASLLYSLAGLHFHLGRMDDARATAKKILELSPNHARARELLGMIDRY